MLAGMLLALALLLPETAPVAATHGFDPHSLTDREICGVISNAAVRANARLPFSEDGVTTGTAILVDCASRRYETRYKVAASRARADAAWQNRIRMNLKQTICRGQLLRSLARRG